MTSYPKKKLIVVLGMHRSGTSAVTRCLRALNVELGDGLLPPMEGVNPTGFWEDLEINALNIEMLRIIEDDWHHLSRIRPQHIVTLRKAGFLGRAAELLEAKLRDKLIFGFKDPRTAKLLPFWKLVFARLKFEVKYVLAIRHPLSVVKSLAKRDRFAPEKSYFLWLAHVLESLNGTNNCQRVLVDYDRLIENSDREIKRLASMLDLTVNTAEFSQYKTEFLDSSMRHTLFEPSELAKDPFCPPLVQEVYPELLAGASGRISLDGNKFQKNLTAWEHEFARNHSVLELADKLELDKILLVQSITGLNETIIELDGQVANLSQSVAEHESQIAALNQAIIERDGQVGNLSQSVAVHENEIAALNQTIVERDGQVANLSQSVAVHENQIAALNQTIVERDGQVANLSQSVAERENQIAALNQTIVERDGQVANLSQSVAEREQTHVAQLTQVRAIIDKSDAALIESKQEFTSRLEGLRQQNELDRMIEDRARSEKEHALHASYDEKERVLLLQLSEDRRAIDRLAREGRERENAAMNDMYALRRENEGLQQANQVDNLRFSHEIEFKNIEHVAAIRSRNEIGKRLLDMHQRNVHLHAELETTQKFFSEIHSSFAWRLFGPRRHREKASLSLSPSTRSSLLSGDETSPNPRVSQRIPSDHMQLTTEIIGDAGEMFTRSPALSIGDQQERNQPPGSGELASVTQLANCEDIMNLEGRDFIETSYQALLKRPSDAGGLEFYLARLQEGSSKAKILFEIFASEEAQSVGAELAGLDEEFLRNGYGIQQRRS